jgi:hypothetical protein
VRYALTRRQWAKRLNEQWDHIRETAVLGFIQLGRDLWASLGELGREQWLLMIEKDLGFGYNTARALWGSHVGWMNAEF